MCLLGEEHSKHYKGPEVGACWVCENIKKEASVLEVGQMEEKTGQRVIGVKRAGGEERTVGSGRSMARVVRAAFPFVLGRDSVKGGLCFW